MGVTCPNCGRENQRPEGFCESCGAFLGWDASRPAGSQPGAQHEPQPGAQQEPQPGAQQEPQPDDQRADVQLQITNGLIEVTPGSAESTAFTIRNLGTKVEEFRCSVSGPEWLVVEPATMTVYPGVEATGTIQAAPPRKPDAAAGVTPFRLTVTSALHAHVSSSASGRIDVAPFYELAAELVPTSSNGHGLTRHSVTLGNRGNVPLRVALSPADVADGLRLAMPAAADVPPGGVIEVPVSVYGSRRWIGRPEPKTFSIVAEPPKPLAPARLSGTRTVIPVFPSWVPVAAGLAVAAVAVTAVAATTVIPKLMAHDGPSQSPSASSTAAQQSAGQSSGPQTSPSQSAGQSSGPQTSASQSAGQSSGPQTSPSQTSPQSTIPAISGVSFTGGTAAPTVTITGHGFGATPPAGSADDSTSCGNYTGNGEVYGTSFQFVDTGNFEAGAGTPPGGDCIGLIVQSWSTDQVVFQFGSAYNSFDHWYITAGDQYSVSVNDLHYTGTVSFAG